MVALFVVTALFILLAIGSGSENSTRDSVTIDSDGNVTTNNDGKTNENSNSNMKYEITNTGFEYYTNSIGGKEYYGYVELKNTGNCDIYLDDCTFDLEDKEGHLLQSDKYISSCPSVISPGETGYFYNGIGSTSIDSSVNLDNGIRLVPQMKLTQAKSKPVSYPVSDVAVREGSFGYVKVTGRIQNTTDKDVSYVYVHIIFYDKNGKVLAITGTSVTDIGAGMKVSFDTSAMFASDNLKLENIAQTKVIAEDTFYQW